MARCWHETSLQGIGSGQGRAATGTIGAYRRKITLDRLRSNQRYLLARVSDGGTQQKFPVDCETFMDRMLPVDATPTTPKERS